MQRKRTARLLIGLIVILTVPLLGQGKKPLTFQDVMKFRAIQDPVLSDDGQWIAYAAVPDRGDGMAYVQSTSGQPAYSLERGSRPVISKDARWVALTVKPPFLELEKAQASKNKDAEPKQGLAVLATATGEWKRFDKVDKFALSDDSAWIALLHYRDETEKPKGEGEAAPKGKETVGGTLELVGLSKAGALEIPFVSLFAFSPDSRFLVYSVQQPAGAGNGVFCRDLQGDPAGATAIAQADGGRYSALVWSREGGHLAFLAAPKSDLEEGVAPAGLHLWHSGTKELKLAVSRGLQGWLAPLKNELRWTRDGRRIFFGQKPEQPAARKPDESAKKEEGADLYHIDEIVKKREGEVWHWNDPRIITQQKVLWPRAKDHTYRAVYHVDTGKLAPLADRDLPEVDISENPLRTLGSSDQPYLKEITWDGNYSDFYIVDLRDGSKKKIVSRLSGRPSLSPKGRYVAYYQSKHWHLFDCEAGSARNLTQSMPVSFADEDHDTPGAPGGYGVAGWTENDEAVLIYDKFDIWQFPTAPGAPAALTGGSGRQEARTFRVQALDPEKTSWSKGESALLLSYNDREKNHGYYYGHIGQRGVERALEEKKRFRFIQKAKTADAVLYTRESYDEFPDLWVSDSHFQSPQKLTRVNPQMDGFAWGEAELVAWNSIDGTPLQGVLLKPGNYEPGRRYPVIVYFYELSSQRMYEFNQPVVNHRPCFAFYTSNGYAVFLPDVRFEAGQPGLSATKCLVPGVQKLIDMGVADPKGIGLHGHSWGGYQTAFVITQTHIFSAAIAGAAVGNMTSAYSGIRWESGLARQMQYEKGQSRIGKTLWEAPQLYLENSPVFYADRIRTPLLIQHGDEDGAVSWYQGIELYLAMRRLGKDCIFLRYYGEPHHLQKYPNKLDYAIKMKEYFDHYLTGAPAPEWIAKGVSYQGK